VPRREDIDSICVIGSGPIVIWQACEFDYAGCQALKVLREEGYRTIVVNSNPATIMTDPGFADRTYIEPLDLESVASVLERGRPDALLPTLGGQTALNLAIELSEAGVLEDLGVELIGAPVEVIRRADDRELFRDAVTRAARGAASVIDVALRARRYPGAVRPAFTLGHGGGCRRSRDARLPRGARPLGVAPRPTGPRRAVGAGAGRVRVASCAIARTTSSSARSRTSIR
jgi:carbamoyl-phosphate synthase large subunit